MASGKSYYPAILISLSLICFFAYQLHEIAKQHEVINSAQKQLNEIRSTTVPKYEDAMSKALQVEGVLNKLAHDVYDLSDKGDELAKKIVDAHGIKYNPPAGTPASSGSGGAP